MSIDKTAEYRVTFSYSTKTNKNEKKKTNRDYSNHLNTALVWYSNSRFVSGIQMPPIPVTLPFENRTPILSGNQVFNIKMDTVLAFALPFYYLELRPVDKYRDV